MIGLVKIILPLAALGAAAWLGSMAARKSYFIPRAKLQATIDGHRAFLIDATKERLDRRRVEAGLQDYVDRSLGGDLQTVDHRLRSRLNRLGEAVGLDGLTVGTGHASSRQSPAKGQFKRRGIQRELRAEIDFVELQGSISGEGTLEQVLGLTHRIQAVAEEDRAPQDRSPRQRNAVRRDRAPQNALPARTKPDRAQPRRPRARRLRSLRVPGRHQPLRGARAAARAKARIARARLTGRPTGVSLCPVGTYGCRRSRAGGRGVAA